MTLHRIKLLAFFLFLSFSTIVTAQITIIGKVVDGLTGMPLQGASIYFNGTSVGASSNTEGKFSIIAPGELTAELIISCIGFETIAWKPNITEAKNKLLLFKLNVKEQQLREVTILPDETRQRWLKIFKSNFLGITEEASRSNLLNTKNIYFVRGKGKNEFKAYSDTPLVIINKMLGYKITFDLVEFSFDEHNNRSYFYGYTLYEELGDKKRWKKNRRQCYYGSTMHFYRSLISQSLKTNGYQVYLIKPMKIKSDMDVVNSGEEMKMAIAVSEKDILQKDSSDSSIHLLTFSGKLMVHYNENPSSKNYLKERILIQGNMPTGFRSFIQMKVPFMKLDNTGVVDDPVNIEYSGYWMYEKAANLLPLNYQPD